MSSTRHTGVIVSVKEAEAWYAEIRKIMVDRGLTFSDAVDRYILQQASTVR